MNITLTFGDFLAIAVIVGLFARGSYAVHGGPSPQELRAQRQLDAIMKHLGLPEPLVSRPGALSPPVLAALADGRRVEAIKLYREETGATLKQAKAAVEQPSGATTASR
jgi:hypothetical protein